MTITPEAARHMESFIDVFLAGPWKDRWRAVLRLPARRWSGIPIASIATPGRTRAGVLREWKLEVAELRTASSFAKRLQNSVQVVRLGHDPDPGVVGARLEEVLNGEVEILEGVISIVPGKLAIVLDHEGNVYVCETGQR